MRAADPEQEIEDVKKVWLVIVTVLMFAVMVSAQAKPDKAKSDSKSGKDTAAQTGKPAPKADTGAAKAAAKLDINSASKDELEKLPGIGPATSQKIIAGRPYRAKNDLVSKNIVSQVEYDKIKEQIIAHQAAAGAKKSASKETPKK